MTSTTQTPSTESNKRRRIMIITADEDILNQIEITSRASEIEPIIVDLNNSTQHISNPIIDTSTPVKRKKTKLLTCVVCGGEAIGYNFDAITCTSCKAFFRRNGRKDPKTIPCEANEYCQVSFKALRRCAACRLIKCLKNGMRRDRLLTNEQQAKKLEKIEENRQLTSIHKPHSESSESLLTDTTSSDSFKPINRTLLTDEEQQHIENIRQYYQKRIDLAAKGGLPWNPTMYATSMLQFINCSSVRLLRLLSYIKQIPEFAELNIDDRMVLIKYNLLPTCLLNTSLFYKPELNHFVETETDAPCTTEDFQKIHTIDLSFEIENILTPLFKLGRTDERIIQLALILALCSKGFAALKAETEPILNDEMAVFRVQNRYTELLWKYLETKYGWIETVRIFNKLISSFIALTKLHRTLYSRMEGMLSPTDADHMLPIMKSLLLLS